MTDDLWRVCNVALGSLGFLILLALLVIKARNGSLTWPIFLAITGGALVNLTIALGSLEVLLGWTSTFRLPVLATALAYVCIGRGLELRREPKRKKER